VIELARRWFLLDAIPSTRVHIGDGAELVARAAPGAWDAVVVDAYDASGMSSPFTERRFFADLRRALAPGGSAAFNVIGALDARGPVRDVARLARASFDCVRLLPVVDLEETYTAHSRRNVVIAPAAVTTLPWSRL
jgi:spermidine synthase